MANGSGSPQGGNTSTGSGSKGTGTDQGQGKQDQSLTDVERAQAIAELRFYAAIHQETVGAMFDGVLLGAAQVQNKRLDLLEGGPEDGVLGSPLVAMVLTFVLEGTIGPAIATVVTQQILRGIFVGLAGAVKLRAQAGRLEKEIKMLRDAASDVEQSLRRPNGKPLGVKAGVLRQQVSKLEGASPKLSHSDARDIAASWRDISRDLPTNIVAASKAARENALRPPAGGTDTGTTAGVTVLSAAMEEAAALRLGISAATEGNVWVLQQPGAQVDDAKTILSGSRPKTFDLGTVRDVFALLTEGIIWAKHLSLSVPVDDNGKAVLTKDLASTNAVSDQKLRDYLRVRFSRAAAEWAAGGGVVDGRPVAQLDAPSAGTPGQPQGAPASQPLTPMESGGFAGGPQDVLTPQQKLANELDGQRDLLVQLYLGNLGSKGEVLGRELASL
jgi:hypothetical protein